MTSQRKYRDIDCRKDHVDMEVTTERYRGAHGTAVARTGFSFHGESSPRIGRGGGGSRGGSREHGGMAEEFFE